MSLEDAPGGGSLVTAYDAEGLPINLIHGQEPAETGKLPKKLILNYEADKPRKSRFQRFDQGAAAVHKVCPQPLLRFLPFLPADKRRRCSSATTVSA